MQSTISKEITAEDNEVLYRPVTVKEIETVLKSTSVSRAMEPDGYS